ncbi:MAG: hypothetical protein BWZ10_02924 [candidate division BRC1 bacterium ADurb.BinA364]|nr:MAG: hypothetical protein BWZ10_02924 [candidate division BRC1 bacterium ADurb.BinA364]
MHAVPSATPAIVRQLPTLVRIRTAAPSMQAANDVSPMLPGIVPQKASQKLQGVPPAASAFMPSEAAAESRVAPL